MPVLDLLSQLNKRCPYTEPFVSFDFPSVENIVTNYLYLTYRQGS